MCMLQIVVIMIGYIITIATSGLIVRHFVSRPIDDTISEASGDSKTKANYDLGAIIGKCENILTLSLILANAFTGLAVIFTAKAIIRSENIKKDPNYYLGGTLVNFTYSVLMGLFIRITLVALGQPIQGLL